MKRLKSIVLAAFAVIAAVGVLSPLFFVPSAHAEGSASLSITPKKNYVIEPGKSVDDTLVIRNLDTTQNLTMNLRVVDFTFTDNGGTPKLFLAEDAAQTTWSLKPYLTVPQTVTVGPSSSKTLKMNVKIPANHGAGSYYSAIVYSTGASEGGNVGLSASGVTLVFTTIPGKVTEDLKLKKLGVYDDSAKGALSGYKYLIDKQPETIGYTLENKGNVTEAPVGSIKLKGWFGKEYSIDNVNPSSSLALIGQTRTYTACIKLAPKDVSLGGSTTTTNTCVDPGLWPGHYKVSIDVFYGQNGNNTQEVTGTAAFWYLPLWFVVTFFVILLILALVIWRLVVKVRKAMYGPKYRKSSVNRRR
jgi:hypothetical protein